MKMLILGCLVLLLTVTPRYSAAPADPGPPCSITRTDTIQFLPFKRLYKLHDVVESFCLEGYSLKGANRSRCSSNGWEPALPTCEGVSCTPPQITNGRVLNPQTFYQENEKLSFQCDARYKASRSEDVICTTDGWKPEPLCEGLLCDRPHILNGYVHWDSWHYTIFKLVNSEILYSCQNGHRTPGRMDNEKTRCTGNGWSPKPKCIRSCSGSDAAVTNGWVERAEQVYLLGEKVNFTCNQGYLTPQGINHGERECLPIGGFTEAKCSRYCVLNQLTNGNYEPKKELFEVGQSLLIQCNNGYMTENRNLYETIQCLRQGWNINPQCIEVTCSLDSYSLLQSEKREYKANEVPHFSCPKGYILVGEERSQCYYYGWGPKLPTCKETLPEKPGGEEDSRQKCPPVSGPGFSQIINPKSEYYSGDEVEINCAQGYILYGDRVTRCVDGKWQSSAQCIQKQRCGNPPSIADGIINKDTVKLEYFTGDTVKYICNPGYSFLGSDGTQCTGGTWLAPPQCAANPCGNPPAVDNGYVIRRKKIYSHGDIAEYNCIEGYKLSDWSPAKCFDGEWSNVPKCVTTSCPPPPSIDNGRPVPRLKAEYVSGDKVQYMCNPGYYLEETISDAECEASQWKSIPVCRKSGASCSTPPVVMYGEFLGPILKYYDSGSLLEYNCPENFTLKGNRIIKCTDGVWDEPPICEGSCALPKETMKKYNIDIDKTSDIPDKDNVLVECQKGLLPEDTRGETCLMRALTYLKCIHKCKSAPDVPNGRVNPDHLKQDGYDSGSSVAFECDEHHGISGPANVKCEAGHWIDLPQCLKPCRISQEDLNANHVELISRDDEKKLFKDGEDVDVKCKAGSKSPVGGIQGKGECSDGKMKYSRCFEGAFCRINQDQIDRRNLELDLPRISDGYYADGEDVHFVCKEGFNVTGSLDGKCENKDLTYPLCAPPGSCVLDHSVIERNKLQQTPKYYFEDGESVTFTCKPGFKALNQMTRICVKKRLIYPRCTKKSSGTWKDNGGKA